MPCTKSVCFTGPRAKKLLGTPQGRDPLTAYETLYGPLQSRLEAQIIALANQGYTRFWGGCAAGFDSIAARAVCHVKALRPDLGVKLALALPWKGYRAGGDVWDALQLAAMDAADSVDIVHDGTNTYRRPSAGRLLNDRNRHMLARSELVLALWPTNTMAKGRYGDWRPVNWQTYAQSRWSDCSGSGTGNMLRDAMGSQTPFIVIPADVDAAQSRIALLAPEGPAASLLKDRSIPGAPRPTAPGPESAPTF